MDKVYLIHYKDLDGNHHLVKAQKYVITERVEMKCEKRFVVY